MRLSDREKKTFSVIALSFLTLIFGFLFGGADPDKRDRVVAEFCDQFGDDIQLFEVKLSDTVGCTHGPDPIQSVADQKAANLDEKSYKALPPMAYRQTQLCPGDGVSGHRVRVYVGSPQGQPAITTTDVQLARITISWAERQLHETHPRYYQKINFYCADDKTPTIQTIPLPPITDGDLYHTDIFNTTIFNNPQPKTMYVVILVNDQGKYPYCGEETVMPEDAPLISNTSLDDPQFGLVACLGTADTFLHEGGHGKGAVQPSAKHSTGNGWHCTDTGEVMCYNDGGDGIGPNNPMHQQCDGKIYKAGGSTWLVPRFDCDGDFYQPDPQLAKVGYFANHWNVAHSPYLTPPKKK